MEVVVTESSLAPKFSGSNVGDFDVSERGEQKSLGTTARPLRYSISECRPLAHTFSKVKHLTGELRQAHYLHVSPGY